MPLIFKETQAKGLMAKVSLYVLFAMLAESGHTQPTKLTGYAGTFFIRVY
jgi:hypothetical protein